MAAMGRFLPGSFHRAALPGRLRPSGAKPSRQRTQSGRERDRAVEYELPGSRQKPARWRGSISRSRSAQAPFTARLAAHQPHWRLPVDRPRRGGVGINPLNKAVSN